MICIAGFIVFAVLGIFSARYRKAAKKAWQCVGRRLTFRPCDSSMKDDIKNRILGKLIVKRPRLARFLDKWLEALAFIFIALTIWSVLVVINVSLNLFVYNTCNPGHSEACSLGSEACSIESSSTSFWDSLTSGRPDKWVGQEVSGFFETVSLIPSRLQDWKAADYYGDNQSFYKQQDSSKPNAIEVIDPGCQFCAKLFANIKEAGFADRYNLTYIVYPIADEKSDSGYKFKNSGLIASYLEATKIVPLDDAETPADWQILERVFTGKNDKNVAYQIAFNSLYSTQEAEDMLKVWLSEFGYSEEQIERISELAGSDEVVQILSRNKGIVEDRIHTVKIPTILFDGDRHDGVLSPDDLR